MSDTVVLSRAEYEALLERIEDAEDAAALAEHRAHEARIGVDAARADYLPTELVDRLIAGESPLLIWRKHRGFSGQQLAEISGVPQSYISEIERGTKPGSVQALARLSKALGVTIEDVISIKG
jgi:hypothetical protein